ncbi:MAG: hypothetical protein U0414_43130 [Polyangiaceae bacterium]
MRRAAVLLLLALSSLAIAASCDASRFPVCKTNDDCKPAKDEPATKTHVCFDFRCVECHYDGDCPKGQICTKTSECRNLSVHLEPDKPQMGEAGSAPRDPEGWEACVKECADAACVSQCDKKFE